MAGLNLTPNLQVMAVETGVFLVNFYIVKQLLLKPYLRVYAERSRQTEGAQNQAEHLEAANEKAAQDIKDKIGTVASEVRTMRDSVLNAAKNSREDVLHKAADEVNAFVSGMRADLSRDLAAERQKIPELVQGLTREFVQHIVPA